MTDADRIEAAVVLAFRFGGIDGAHHKTWVIDQMLRILAGINYDCLVAVHNDGPDTFAWDTGIAP